MSNQTTTNANVVLNADVSQYNAQAAQAAQQTNKLADAVDNLQKKLDGLTARAGRKLQLFAAADLAGLTAMTAQAAAFEKSLSTLRATTTITGASMNSMTNTINSMARQFPVSRAEVTQMVTALTRLGIQGPQQIDKLTSTFIKLGAATGESSQQLAVQLTSLTRQMGNINADSMERYANVLASISANAGVAAGDVLNFAQAIAPVGRAAGMTQTQLLGVATAFTKAGADGYAAANTFNQMISTITRATVSGSPDIAKYSNLIGVTIDQFKQMSSADQITSIFDAINKSGPQAINVLDQLGIDGVRAVRSIQAVTQTGGLRQALSQAGVSFNDNSSGNDLNSASAAAMGGVSDTLTQIRNNFAEISTTIGTTFLTPLNMVLKALNNMLSLTNSIGQGFMTIGGVIAGIGGIGAGALGTILTLFKTLTMLGTARFLYKSSPVQALVEGFKGGRMMAAGDEMGATAANATMRRASGMDGGLRWWQRPFAAGGIYAGQAFGGEGGPGGKAGGILSRGLLGIPSWVMNGQADFMKAAATNGYDRDGGMLGKIGDKFAKMYNSTDKLAEGFVKVTNETEKSITPIRGLANAAQRIVGWTTVAGTRAVGDGIPAATKGAGKLFNALGGGTFIAATAGIGIGSAIWQAHQDNQASMAQGNVSADGIAKYDEALGISTNSLSDFTTAIKSATAALPTPSNTASATAVTSAQVSAASMSGRSLTNPFLGTLGNAAQAKSWLKAQGSLNPSELQQITLDMIQNFGPDSAKDIMGSYVGGSGRQARSQASGISGLMNAEFQDTGSSAWDRFKGAMTGAPTNNQTALIDISTTGITKTINNLSNQYGQKYANTAAMPQIQAYLKGLASTDQASQIYAMSQFENKFLKGKQTKFSGDASNINDIVKLLQNDSEGSQYYRANFGDPTLLLNKTFSAPTGNVQNSPFMNSLIRSTGIGGALVNSKEFQAALASPSDITAQYQAGTKAYGVATGFFTGKGASPDNMARELNSAVDALQRFRGAVNDTTNAQSQAAAMAQQLIGIQMSSVSVGQGRLGKIGTAADAFRKDLANPNKDPQYNNLIGDATTYQNQANSYQQFLQSSVLQFKSFSQQMHWQQVDFTVQQGRSNHDFYQQMGWQADSFYRQRARSFRDFNIQLQRQAEDAAKTIYDPYTRVMAQYTEGGQSLVMNLEDQNRRINQQYANLQRLRKAGVSQQVISTLALNDPNNAQQLQRFVEDIANDPKLIAQINATVAARVKGTKRLTQSSFNDQFTRQVADFKRGLKDAQTEFNIAQNQASIQHTQAMDRMVADFAQSARRAKKTMADGFLEVTGNLASTLAQAIAAAGTALGPFGDKVIAEFNAFKKANPELFGNGGVLALIGSGSAGAPGAGVAAPSSPATGHAPPVSSKGRATVPRGGYVVTSGTTTSSHVSYSTTYNVNGPIQASDPNKLAAQLQAKARLAKLASAGGSQKASA